MPVQEWSAAEIERLRQMWDEGKPASVIAATLKRPKNSVVGKVHRLGLASRPSPILRDPSASSAPASRNHLPKAARLPGPPQASHGGNPDIARAARIAHTIARPPRVEVPPAVPQLPAAAPISGACRWPMWPHNTRPAFGEHRFCEAVRSDPRHPYCAAHAAIAFTPWARAA